MRPTLRAGDRVVVEKVAYRFGAPQRGDVIVFERRTGAASGDDGSLWRDITESLSGLFGAARDGRRDYIKRVVAVGGETAEGRDSVVYVDGVRLEEPYTLAGKNSSFAPVEVPKGSVFVLGGNRTNSNDSRSFGVIPLDSVVGRAVLLVWPPEDFGTL
jgi:signal peptidase I